MKWTCKHLPPPKPLETMVKKKVTNSTEKITIVNRIACAHAENAK